jgi:excisionase family DNA binding protein
MNHRAPRMLKVSGVAHQLFVSEKSVRRWIDAGELHSYRVGRQIRVSEDDLAAYIALRRV